MSHFRKNTSYVFLAAVLLVLEAAAAQPPLSPEQLIDRYSISDLVWSSDGQRLAAVVTAPSSGDGSPENIWMYDLRRDEFRQLTNAGKRNNSPRWSADGETLAFLSSRSEGNSQIFAMSMNGGEAQPLTGESLNVNSFEWSPDGAAIAFVASDSEAENQADEGDSKDDEIVVSDTIKPMLLHLLDVATHTTKILTAGHWRVSAFAWRPDGTGLVLSATDNFSTDLLTDRFFAVQTDGQKMTEISRPDGPVSNLSVSPDNRFVAYIGSTGGGPIAHGIFLQPLAGGDVIALTDNSLDRMISDYAWATAGGIWALAVDGFSDQLVRFSMDGVERERKIFSGQSIAAFDVTGSTFAYVKNSSVEPQELWVGKAADERQVSHLNDDFPALIEPELIHYAGHDGRRIEAAIFKPKKSSPPRRGWKTVLLIHGGPTGRWEHRINDWAQLLVARGFVVIAPNIRGSIGYGLEFVRSNRHDWGGADYRDAIAGIDHLIESGISDPDRIAVAGWSYGGYMAAWAITQTNRFKAAIVGAAMTDLAVEYGTEMAEINAYDTWFLGTPYENLDDFVRMSPMTYIKNARTPALILIGEKDRIDPIGQSWQFYRGLRRYGVDAQMVIYPREPHRIRERSHRIDVMSRMLEWIEKYTN